MTKNELAILLILGALFAPALANAQSIVEESRVPGGVAVVELPWVKQERPQASYLGNPVMVRQQAGRWYAIIGLGLKTNPGKKILKLAADKKDIISFSVANKHYPTQYAVCLLSLKKEFDSIQIQASSTHQKGWH